LPEACNNSDANHHVMDPGAGRSCPGADLLAVEAYTFDRPVRYHLDYQTLRAHLGVLHAERVVLTHMSAAMLARLTDPGLPAAYDGNGRRPLTTANTCWIAAT
jgi:hypothetical protein